MSFDASGGRVQITDGAGGPIVFDTDDQLLHLLASAPITGSITRGTQDFGGPSAGIARTRNADLFVANLPAAATHIVGMVRYDFSGGNIITDLQSGAWYLVGGSHILYQKTYQAPGGAYQQAVSNMAVATFYKSGSTIRFKEQIRFYDGRLELTGGLFPGYTATYWIFPAAFN